MGKTCVYDTSSEFTYEGIIGHWGSGTGMGGQVDRAAFRRTVRRVHLRIEGKFDFARALVVVACLLGNLERARPRLHGVSEVHAHRG